MAEPDSSPILKEIERREALLLEQAADIARAREELARLRELAELATKHNMTLTPKASHEAPCETVDDLARQFKSDGRSAYGKLRHRTRKHYDVLIRRIVEDHGHKKLAQMKSQDADVIYSEWMNSGKLSMAHAMISMFRALVYFGANILENQDCMRLATALHKKQFKAPKKQPTEYLNAAQAEAIRKEAHRRGRPSIALAQALQFDLGLRQVDVLGEWVPVAEHGVSEIMKDGSKWIRGIRWDEIDDDLILSHHDKIGRGKKIHIDLKTSSMVMEELNALKKRPTSGPMIMSETTGYPWGRDDFRKHWRKIADDCGIPKSVQNGDSHGKDKSSEPDDHQDEKEARMRT